ncbi:hypothetical protein VTL71DRAFT_9202 [Oculimacula yallundae]|uniref:Uncharacterized protein n=1 Tax=Oculimacula yallundae TaxID=86028 RepID=A0ABR4BTM3_9HELO
MTIDMDLAEAQIVEPVETRATGSASVLVRPTTNPQASYKLPESIECVAAVEWCGFIRSKAENIYENWTTRPDQCPDGLIDYMTAAATRLKMEPLISLPPAEALVELGISEDLRSALLDSKHAQLFRSQTLYFWVKDTIKMRCAMLWKIHEKTGAQPEESRNASTPTQLSYLPQHCATVQTPPPVLSDHYVFYIGKSASELGDLNCLVRENGSIHLGALSKRGGGDFNEHREALYLSKERETAEQYRQWAARRNPHSESWIIRIQIPKSFVDCMLKRDLWYGEEWKKFVYYCRSNGNVGEPPSWVKRFGPVETQLIEGPICARAPSLMPKIKEDIQHGFSEKDLLYNGDRMAKQSAIILEDSDMKKRLEDLLRGRIFIEIFP